MASKSTDSISTVNDLNDDCLLHIFSYLSTKETFRIERVCKRWQKILKTMRWKKLIIPVPEGWKNEGQWEYILPKCGKIVTNLSIYLNANICNEDEDIFYEDVEEGFEAIDQFCKNLLHLDVEVNYFDPVQFLNVKQFPFLKKLKSLNISPVENDFNDKSFLEAVLLFIKEAKYLEKFSCTDICKRKISINTPEKKIEISRFFFSGNHFQPLFERFSGFTNLKLSYTDFSHEMLNPISNRLNSLELNYYPYNCFEDGALENLQYDNLRKLKFVQCPYLNDQAIRPFLNCPLLQEIYLKHCYHFSGSDNYRCLGKLKQITVLQIKSEKLTGNILDYLAGECNKLEEIRCSKVKNLSASELENIVAVLPNLKYLKIQGLQNCTRQCFESILESVRQRNNGEILQIEFKDKLEVEEIDNFRFRKIEKNSAELRAQLLIIRLNLISEPKSITIKGPGTSLHFFSVE